MKQNGFTLIELMIIVTIVAILVSIALPVYTNDIIRNNASWYLTCKDVTGSVTYDDIAIAKATHQNGYLGVITRNGLEFATNDNCTIRKEIK